MAARHRKKKRKQNLKQTDVKRMPHARRKGGQYIYPAGAYRAAMIAPPASMPAVVVPETEIKLAAVAEAPAAGEQTTVVIPEPAEEGWRRWLYYGAAVAAVLMLVMALMPSQKVIRTAGLTKLSPENEHVSEIELAEAETVKELKAVVEVESVRKPLEDYISTLSGDWAVYLKNLNNDEVLMINDHQMPSASLIKLFVAGTYFEQLESGALGASPRTERDLSMMISWSDNTAWEDLETCIGGGSYMKGLQMVTDFARAHGYEDTGRLIGGASVYSGNNLTSVSDVGRVLDEILSGTYVSESASASILDLMKEQHITTKIPAGLPDGIESANKTGELVGIENDAAVVYGLNTEYILVVMSDGNNVGTGPVVRISEIVYDMLNPGSAHVEE